MNRGKRQQLLGYLFIAPSFLGVIVLFVLPALLSLAVVFTDWKFMQGNVHFVGFDNVAALLHDDLFYMALRKTCILVLTVPASIGIGFILAVILNDRVLFKRILRSMFFLPYISTGIGMMFVWMLLFQPQQGPVNSLLHAVGFTTVPGWLSTTTSSIYAIDIIQIWFAVGFNLIIYLAALQEIPQEQLESAKLDGAGFFTTVRRIILPLVSPSTFLLFIIGFIGVIKSFGMIQAITGGGPANSTTVLAVYVYRIAFRYYDMGYASTISWVLFLLVFAVTFIQWYGQKKWVHY